MLIRDVGPGMVESLEFLHDRLSYLLGHQNLSGKKNLSYADDAFEFLHTCSDPHFLDAIEYLVHHEGWRYIGGQHEPVIDRLNEFFKRR